MGIESLLHARSTGLVNMDKNEFSRVRDDHPVGFPLPVAGFIRGKDLLGAARVGNGRLRASQFGMWSGPASLRLLEIQHGTGSARHRNGDRTLAGANMGVQSDRPVGKEACDVHERGSA